MLLALYTGLTVGLCIGFTVGIGFGLFLAWLSRREIIRKDEQMQMLDQEKMIVFDFVHNMAEAIGEGIGRQELMERVVHAAVLSTGAMSACIFERNGDLLRGVAVEGLFPPHRPLPQSVRSKINTRANFVEQVLKSEVFKVGEGLVGRAADTGTGILIEDALADPQIIKHEDPALEIRSVIVVPINFRQRNLAVLAIVNPSDGGPFGRSDYSLAEGLAEQAGLAIHNLDLLETQIEKNNLDADLGLAREIQSMLLPKAFPSMAKLDMATIYSSSQKVGGDLYDVFTLDETRIGLAIADVSGKGISASLLMAICQSNLRHIARKLISPAEVLRELNVVMLEETRPEMFVTIIYAVLDTEKDELVFARGGHELPILVRRLDDGTASVDLLESDGMALGMVPDAIFQQATVDHHVGFKKNDILVLYTDGVTEVQNAHGEEFGNRRLSSVVKSLDMRSAEGITKGITERIRLFSGTDEQMDDLTLVIAKHR